MNYFGGKKKKSVSSQVRNSIVLKWKHVDQKETEALKYDKFTKRWPLKEEEVMYTSEKLKFKVMLFKTILSKYFIISFHYLRSYAQII